MRDHNFSELVLLFLYLSSILQNEFQPRKTWNRNGSICLVMHKHSTRVSVLEKCQCLILILFPYSFIFWRLPWCSDTFSSTCFLSPLTLRSFILCLNAIIWRETSIKRKPYERRIRWVYFNYLILNFYYSFCSRNQGSD